MLVDQMEHEGILYGLPKEMKVLGWAGDEEDYDEEYTEENDEEHLKFHIACGALQAFRKGTDDWLQSHLETE